MAEPGTVAAWAVQELAACPRPLNTCSRRSAATAARRSIDDLVRGTVKCTGDDPYLVRDAHGHYRDKSRTSEVHPLGRSGVPTCGLRRRVSERS
jgi:hypothetical protein